ncbi:cytochrome P450 4C1-like [Vanessa cardui]|uniref:cytochrome P450 4C1-like n=1 Tax=Vanessa cardui TaxID=171605 RepID=UPI001F149707|nr:cytochrome P450 4C1-like [Vanessa cardui]
MFAVLISLIGILIVWCIHLRFSRDGRLFAKIPGPKGLPVLGNAFQFLLPPEKLFMLSRELYKTYKGVIQLHALNFRCVNIYDPEDMAIILSKAQFHEKEIPYGFLKPWLREGILTSNGKKWHYRRKMLTPSFHLNILKKFVQIFVVHMEDLIKTIETEEVSKDKTNIYELTSHVALKIMCETSMGLSKESNLEIMYKKYFYAIEKFGYYVTERVCRIWLFFDWIFNYSNLGRKQKSIVQELHAFSNDVIRDRRKFLAQNRTNKMDAGIDENKRHLAMIDLLFENERNNNIDESGIREEVDAFLFAGFDTISTTLMFLIMRIANEPAIQEKIREEIDSIFGNSTRSPTIEDLNEMKYTDCCIKETLRIYPAVPYISRHLKEEVVLGGYRIPADTQINIMIYDLHQREDIYPEPKKFIPERFLPINQIKRHPYAFLPFSAGPRNCLGQKFAMLEMKTLISGIIRKYHIEPVTRPEELAFNVNMILRTTKPIYARFRKRNL